ncbi:hypothetical protein A3B21_03990 [Candidatus Uhrbacteria bacterium RIFCSPLOWO2_01_FULL_47_24]|uniref:IPT/TIG domain-containing protein n=1 Tax=Candidatus Uhrbacteria bacterium RIFCSPLOWO2_01_FULL_47_24 TaxID=1802401 RepID=A0A1F7UT88_9BACT|nr:MAG: hypothetical protein A3D58_02695 [Candidatus Uhrbacteria bacterium RIFCSPHIGHO2_02_FULL_46_47]OGL74798.1 MAG: hypothetical protein A3F52_04550 [Candidatus Uhrbacteria bacterium RIFCSPHIGHO2_12_FULL_47_11]OGL81502.1 MAG: hypothetical protein A3B21_03990 [Candidatus Uhrbacteria bacterium RIFCSPLOWO2_01_FULL_47_24]OGL83747.1 MAG: hypothetical protein A3J03_01445 [Candidatus Uhrbacteria bacterium RIFCSPLOWO2_02_FULL_46_25]OGL93616.1 MAG: hypothetical protein A3H11_05325 [Candidatus Uhrbacte
MTIGRVVTLVFILTVLGYIGSHLRSLLAPPPLELASPLQGLTTSNNIIEIKGKTLPGATVEINGSPLTTLTDGQFSHLLVLNGGINTIVVSAKKRYSRPTVIQRQIFILEGGKISYGPSI